MVRRCIAEGCKESDISILSHRFPKTQDIAEKWQRALSLEKYTIDDLQKKFVVCTKHFAPKSYRNEISNSLNTTAVPNLDENEDNERIYTTDPSIKKQQNSITPARCHKLPPNAQKRQLDVSTNSKVKFIRLNADKVTEYLSAHKIRIIDELEQEIEEIVPSEDVEETFEVCEMANESEEAEQHLEKKHEESQEPFVEHFDLLEKNLQAIDDPVPEILQCDQETQTDPTPEIIKVINTRSDLVESKDDKLIKLLYPEFQDFDKIQLIELVNERDRKIEALEDKIKKLELAMRNLL